MAHEAGHTETWVEYQARTGGSTTVDERVPLGVPFASRPLSYDQQRRAAAREAARPQLVPLRPGQMGPPTAGLAGPLAPLVPGQMGPPTMRTQPTSEIVPARYFQGDEYNVALTMPPEERAAIQQQMRRVGLIGANTPVPWGEWDTTSANAFREVLTMANVNGVTWHQQMVTLRLSPDAAVEGSGGQRPALTIRTTSPDDLRSVFDQVSERTLGRRASPEEMDRMVAGYHSREAEAQRQGFEQTYAADGTPGAGGTTVDAPSAQNFAEQETRRSNPGEAGAKDIADQFDAFLDIIGGAGG